METRSNHILVGAVVLILLAVLALFTIWLARLGGGSEKEYDIFFKQSVDGLAKGSTVTFSGVPSGQVADIVLWQPDPQYVRVRVKLKDETPVVRGTTATVQGSFTGTSSVSLDGAVRGAPPITAPGRAGVPEIPTRAGGIGAILSSAPQLLERLTTLTERLSELLSDRNQNSIAGILANTDRLTSALADRGPELAETIAQTQVAIRQAGAAAQQIGQLAGTTNAMIDEDVRPAVRNLNSAIAAAKNSAETLDAAITDARPGLQAFSKQTIPEVGLLVRDLRRMSDALASVAEKVDRGGLGSAVGSPRLPDYNPK